VLVIATLGVLAALAPMAHARSDPPSADFFGLNVEQMFNGGFASADRWPSYIGTFAGEGIRTGRAAAFWDRIEPNPPSSSGVHSYDWAHLDQVARYLAPYGVRMTLVLTHSPQWASSGPPNSDYVSYPPRSETDFAAFARALAARYGDNGTFWTEHRELPHMSAINYEIWNEENHVYYWRSGPDPAQYVRLYNAARSGIKQADPGARVLVGGVVWNDDAQFIRGLYDAAGSDWQPDGIGLHPYANSVIGIIINLRRVYQALHSMGQRPPLYLSELGWEAAPYPQPGADHWYTGALGEVTRAGLIAFLGDAVVRSDCNIRNFVLYDVVETGLNLYDTNANPNFSGQAFTGVAARYPDETDGSLSLCGGGSPVADQLKLDLDPRPGSDGCYAPFVTYRGFPIEEARVFYTVDGGSSGFALTDGHGVASYCPRAADAAKRLWLWAEVSWDGVPAIGSSDAFTCSPCARTPAGTRPPASSGTERSAGPRFEVSAGSRITGAPGNIGLSIRPRAVHAGSRTRVVFSVIRRKGKRHLPVVGATVHFGGVPLRTNKYGRVAWFARYGRAGRHRVTATKLGAHRAVSWLRVVR